MDASSSCNLEYDEGIALKGLYDAFGSFFSLEEIASAYSKAGHDADMAGEILSGLQEHDLNVITQAPNGVCSTMSQELFLENNSKKSAHLNNNSKGSKPRKVSFSIGTVSSVLGRRYVKPSLSLNGSCKGTKPLKLELKEPSTDELQRDTVVPDFAPRNDPINNKDIEEFLFAMLGDGFQLDLDVIREVLGSCGYDARKSMEKLLDLSTTTLDKTKGIHDDVTGNLSDMCSKKSQESLLNKDIGPSVNGAESPGIDKKYNLSKEVLEALFTVPERFEEAPKRNHPVRAMKRTRAIGKVVTAPLECVVDSLPIVVERQQDIVDASEDDNYQVLRRASKQNWDAMKIYYGAALDAFLKGASTKATYLLEEGKIYNNKAREADEKSAREIVKTRNVDAPDVVTLNLHHLASKDAIRLLKKHLSYLANIPSIQFLKLVLEANTEDITKGARKRLVMKLLEKENIAWIEEGNAGTISIRIDKVDPEKLSFGKVQA